uniref:AWS domain-containing protein n=1 Tax=Aegilops tauschii TaxID=37682 RepID=R7WF43_AEGTA
MAGPPRPAPAAPPVRRSARLRPQATHQPPCSPPPPSPPAAAGSPGGTDPRRSVRISVRTRVRGLPSAAPSSSRIRRKSPAAPLRRTVQACAEEWGAVMRGGVGGSEGRVRRPGGGVRPPVPPERRAEEDMFSLQKENNLAPAETCNACMYTMFAASKQNDWALVISVVVNVADSVICSSYRVQEAFRRLPLPYADQEFNINPIRKEELESVTKPPPYKCDGDVIEAKCSDCDPPLTCQIRCSCSCSQACKCSNKCSNRPFRREKRIGVVKTQHCGWGAIALETIEEGDFVIEFVGEDIQKVT